MRLIGFTYLCGHIYVPIQGLYCIILNMIFGAINFWAFFCTSYISLIILKYILKSNRITNLLVFTLFTIRDLTGPTIFACITRTATYIIVWCFSIQILGVKVLRGQFSEQGQNAFSSSNLTKQALAQAISVPHAFAHSLNRAKFQFKHLIKITFNNEVPRQVSKARSTSMSIRWYSPRGL